LKATLNSNLPVQSMANQNPRTLRIFLMYSENHISNT